MQFATVRNVSMDVVLFRVTMSAAKSKASLVLATFSSTVLADISSALAATSNKSSHIPEQLLHLLSSSNLAPGKVGEGAIGLGHSVGVFFFLYCCTTIVISLD